MSNASLHFALPDSGATEALGVALARAYLAMSSAVSPTASSGAVVHLRGELGSGKTTCARSLLHTLGVTGTVRSPTYTLVDTYSISDGHGHTLNCVHVDLYRIRSGTEVEELGLRDLTGPGYLMLIEWPEKSGGAVPPADLDLHLAYAGEARAASVRATGDVGGSWLEKLSFDSSLVPYVSNLT